MRISDWSSDVCSSDLFHAPVIGSRGGKGEPVRRLIEQYRPSVAVFIDDLAGHHQSVAEAAPDVWRLHLVGEPAIADKIAPPPYAHENGKASCWERRGPVV